MKKIETVQDLIDALIALDKPKLPVRMDDSYTDPESGTYWPGECKVEVNDLESRVIIAKKYVIILGCERA